MYAALARAVLDETRGAAVAERIERLKRRHPRASRDELAARLIRSAALQCGAAGLVWSGPAAFFGSMPLGPDLGFQVAALNRLILALSAVYRSDASGRDRIAGVATGVGVGLAADSLRRGLVALLTRALPKRPGARAVAGGLAGGALAYATAIAVGKLARDYFATGGTLLGRRRFW
ncbi:MAG TPA: hypothetical protein VGK26_02740 [Thermoanaerobaculia bacterium]|jgi:hypothetical protein